MKRNHYLRPWKLGTFAAGMALLLIGAVLGWAPDWDIPVSLLMGVATFLTAEWVLRVLVEVDSRPWWQFFLAAFLAWLSIDGLYALYWWLASPEILALMRDAQWSLSLLMYMACGVLWLLDDPDIFEDPFPDAAKPGRDLGKRGRGHRG